MAQALAYQQPARHTPERGRPGYQPQRPPLRVLPGTGVEAHLALAPLWRALFVTGIVMVLLIGAVWVARVNLSDATMRLAAASEQLARQTEAERAEGARLEVQYALATSPTSIQEAATSKLGMSPDPRVEYLRIPAGK